MKNLFLIIKEVYLNQIYLGEKPNEYRATSEYFKKKLVGREYETITLQAGYRPTSPRLVLKYKGYTVEKLTHEFFGPDEVEVFAIDVTEIIEQSNINHDVMKKAGVIYAKKPVSNNEVFINGQLFLLPEFPVELSKANPERVSCKIKFTEK